MPVRQSPDAPVLPDRATAECLPSSVLLVSNMYPSDGYPKFGSFVATSEEAVRALGVDVRRAVITDPRSGKLRLLLKYFSLLLRTLAATARGGYGQVHAHYLFPSGAFARVAARLRGVPLVLFAHGSDVLLASWRWPVGRWTRSVTASADLVVAPSEHLRQEIADVFGLPAGRIVAIPTPVDTGFWKPSDRGEARRRQGLDDSARYVLFAGALDDNKGLGFEDVLRALGDSRLESLNVIRVGEGQRRQRLDDLALELGVAGRIDARGFVGRDDLRDLYAAADVVVVPSRRESLGLVALEAQAVGTPVVACRVGGLPEHVLPGVTGELYDPEDIAALADALYRVLVVPGPRAYNPAVAVKGYDPATVVAALRDAMCAAAERT
jgi:glycosyltransferase involved in cell wall biosynthesis